MSRLETFLTDLRSTDGPTRFLALSRLEALPQTPESIARLEELVRTEGDPTILFYVRLILAGISGGKNQTVPAKETAGILASLKSSLEASPPDFPAFFLQLRLVPKAKIQEILPFLREQRWQKYPAAVLPFFLRLFRDSGTEDDVPALEELSSHADSYVVSRAVDALSRFHPKNFGSLLVPLLINPSPGIRAQAIRNLAKIDPLEAKRHFEEMLFSVNSDEKAAAISQSHFFPFENVERILLRFLSLESNPELVEKVGQLCIINTTPELPQKLLEIFDHASGAKKAVLKEMTLQSIRFLEKAGLIQSSAAEFLEEKKRAFQVKKARESVKRCETLLESGPLEDRVRAVEGLIRLKNLGFQDAETVLAKIFGSDQETEIRARLEEWLQMPAGAENLVPMASRSGITPGSGSPADSRLPSPDPRSPSPDSRSPSPDPRSPSPASSVAATGYGDTFPALLVRIQSLSPEEFSARRPAIFNLMDRLKPIQRASLLQTVFSFDGREGIAIAREALRSAHPEELAVAVGFFVEFPDSDSTDTIFSLTGHEHPDVRLAAMKALVAADKPRAVERCRQWLLSSQPGRRREGIQLSACFDFPAVRSLLLECFSRERDGELLKALLAGLAPHLDTELFLNVAHIIREFPERLKTSLTEALPVILGSGPLGELPEAERKELLTRAAGAPESNPDDSGSPVKEYSLEEIRIQRLSRSSSAPPSAEPPLPESPAAVSPVLIGGDVGAPADGSGASPSPDSSVSSGVPSPRAPEQKAPADSLLAYLELLAMSPERWSAEEAREVQHRLQGESEPLSKLRLQVLRHRQEQKEELPRLRQTLPTAMTRTWSEPVIDAFAAAFLTDLLTRRESPAVMPILRKAMTRDIPAEYLPFLLLAVKKFGDAGDSPFLAGHCRHGDPRVVYLAMEALEKVNPEDLKPLFVTLLSHTHPLIRSRAIRFLYTCDPIEAAKHFSGALFSDDPEERTAALKNAFFLPFSEVEPLLMKLLARESLPGIWRGIGNVIRANPQPEVPLHLMEIFMQAAGERRAFIRFLLEEVVQLLFKAGLVAGSFADYLRDLKAVVARKSVLSVIDRLKPGLLATDTVVRSDAVTRMATHVRRGIPEAREILESHLTGETDEELRREIKFALSGDWEKALEDSLETIAPPDSIFVRLSRITKETFPAERLKVYEVAKTGIPRGKLCALQILAEFGGAEDVSVIRECLADPLEAVVLAAIDALEQLDRDALIQSISPLLEHSSPQVKAMGMKFQAACDPGKALQKLEKLLNHLKPNSRWEGILAAGQTDFSIVSDLLISALQKEPVPEHRTEIRAILLRNISLDVFFPLFVAHSQGASPAGEWTEFLAEAGRKLASLPTSRFGSQDELLAYVREKHQENMSPKRNALPYSYQNVRKILTDRKKTAEPAPVQETPLSPPLPSSPPSPPSPSETIRKFLEGPVRVFLKENLWLMAGIGGILLVVLFALTPGDQSPNETSGAKTGAPKAEPPAPLPTVRERDEPFQPGQIRNARGIVTKVLADGIEIRLSSPVAEVFGKWLGKKSSFKIGDVFRGRIQVEHEDNGRWRARVLEIY